MNFASASAHAHTEEVRHRIGRRGAVLLLLGTIYVLLGLGFLIDPPHGDAALVASYAFPLRLTSGSMAVWGGVFVASGLISVFPAFWPSGRDAWGFQIMATLSLVWASFGLLTVLAGGSRGWIVCLLFAAVGGLVLIVSGMRGIDDEPGR